MTTIVEALRAIVALDDGDNPDLWPLAPEFNEARAALSAHDAKPAAEPVAEVFDTFGNSQDPTKCVGHVWLKPGCFPPRGTKLYTHPAPPLEPQKLRQDFMDGYDAGYKDACHRIDADLAERSAQPAAESLLELESQYSRVLHEMAGSVSLCWSPRPDGVFESTQACEYVAAAIEELRSIARAAMKETP
jgi:hypothetical protein